MHKPIKLPDTTRLTNEMREPTFIFQGNKVYAMLDGAVVASGTDVEEVEQKLAATPPYEDEADPGAQDPQGETEMPQPPEEVQGDIEGAQPSVEERLAELEQRLQQLEQGEAGEQPPAPGLDAGVPPAPAPPVDPHHGLPPAGVQARVTTPNGLEGTVLGRTQDLWSETVTVRFDNGRIVNLPVTEGMTFKAAEEKKEVSLLESLRERLAHTPDGTAASLAERRIELLDVIKQARMHLAAGGGEADLHSLVVEARAEIGELEQALEHLASEEVEAFAPPAPFKMQAVEQESMGPGNGTWLDNTLGEMIAEAEATNYEQLMDEGPEAFVADVSREALAHAGTVRNMAATFIRSHTAAADPSIREQYESVWLARVEEVRRAELAKVKEATKKEAASEPDHSNLPDDTLFL